MVPHQPTNQPKERLVKKRGIQPPTVVPITNPSREVTDSALTESTVSQTGRTGIDGVVRDGHFVESSPLLRRTVLVVGGIVGDRGDKHHDKLEGAGIAIEPRSVQTSRDVEPQAAQSPTPSIGRRSLPGNIVCLVTNNDIPAASDEGRPANDRRGVPDAQVCPANGEPAGVEEEVNHGGDVALVDVGTRPANEEPGPSRPANQRASTGVVGGKATPRRCNHAKGGICAVHGPGAKLRWRPVIKGVGDAWDKTKEYFYVCDLSKKAKKWKQTRLSFDTVTSPREGSPRNHGESL